MTRPILTEEIFVRHGYEPPPASNANSVCRGGHTIPAASYETMRGLSTGSIVKLHGSKDPLALL